ncbi:hypothetical protein DFH08DRAFT_779756 [Mycena albidolilacea]|uniref:Uncharacterized protein n=1 Tax=Mycena albidolilacea TaxID=1033008 RepID=A0AAD7A1H0_9AGAR|nr:hypothetical protein DFH08DRAFT_779756 [Mycena albidolilacea]
MSKTSSQPLLVNVSPSAGLPPYQTYPTTYQTINIPVSLHIEVQPPRPRPSLARRFFIAFSVAVSIWVIIASVHHHGHGSGWYGRDDWDVPANMILEQCVRGGASSNSSHAIFEIPLNSDTVLLLSRYRSSSFFGAGSSVSGSLGITTSPRLNNTAKISVHSLHGADTKACLVTGPDGETGVGLFSKGAWFSPGRGTSFVKINVLLPRPKTPLELNGIVANLPNFSFDVGNLKDSVHFGSATFTTSNSPVNVKSLTADRARLHSSNGQITVDSLISPDLTVQTSNSGISGTFNTSGTLKITTSNAPIKANVNLESNDKNRPTEVHMCTSNHRLDVKVILVTDARAGGDFVVTGTTSNGPLAIAVPGSPADSTLSLTARTSNKPADVRLHGAYQGAFGVSTSNFKPEVKRVDEEGDGRHVEYEGVGGGRRGGHGAIKGWVYEKDRNRELGNVTVRTSNAAAVLWV